MQIASGGVKDAEGFVMHEEKAWPRIDPYHCPATARTAPYVPTLALCRSSYICTSLPRCDSSSRRTLSSRGTQMEEAGRGCGGRYGHESREGGRKLYWAAVWTRRQAVAETARGNARLQPTGTSTWTSS